MRAVDANVLVRLIVRDHQKHVASAEAFVANGAWISLLALAETIGVLSAVYGRRPEEIALAIDMLLAHQHLTLQDPDVVSASLAQFRKRPAVSFSDCLLVEIARKAGHVPLGTFDRALGKVDGAQAIVNSK